MNVSANFKLSEFAVSAKYPELAANISLTDVDRVKASWIALTILEPVRKHTGRPWGIESGKRDALLNKVVNGVPTSNHRWRNMAAAVDAKPNHPDPAEQDRLTLAGFNFVRTVLPYSFGELILYVNDDGTLAQIHIAVPTIEIQGRVRVKFKGAYHEYSEEFLVQCGVKVQA